MGHTPTGDVATRTTPPGAVGAGVLVGVAVLLALLGPSLLRDGDTLWHVATGEWILDTGTLPRSDPFSWTFLGEPWIAKEWLSQVLLAAVARGGGWTGVVAVAAIAVAAAFGILADRLARHWSTAATLAAVAVAFVLAAPHLLARPHALALPVEVAWVAAVVRSLDEDDAGPPWWSLVLVVLWANLHAGVLLAPVLAAAGMLEAVLGARDPGARRAATVRWGPFVLGTVVAGAVTPYGPGSLLAGLEVLGLGPALAVIPEWQPQDFSRIGAFEVVLLGAVGAALVRGVRLPLVRVLVVLGLLHLALAATRNGELLGLLAPLYLAAPLSSGPGRAARPSSRRWSALLVTAGVTAAVVLAALRSPVPPAELRPTDGVAAVERSGRARLLHEYAFGGHLIAVGVPTFVDGRTELYGGPFVAAHATALALDDVDLLEELLRSWDVDVTLLRPGTPAVALLDRSPAWTRVHTDELSVVHVRADGAPAGIGLG